MKRRTHGNHQLEPLRHCSQRSGSRPCIERWGLNTFNIVEVQFGDQGQIVADLLAAPGETAGVFPCRLHPLIFHVAQPSTEDRQPIAVTHLESPPLEVVYELCMRIETDHP